MNDADRVSLREFILVQLVAVEQRFAQYIDYSNDRLTRTEKDLERRLETMNEFRSQLTRQAAEFVTRQYFETKYDGLEQRLTTVEKSKNVREGQWALVGLLIVIAIQAATLLYRWTH